MDMDIYLKSETLKTGVDTGDTRQLDGCRDLFSIDDKALEIVISRVQMNLTLAEPSQPLVETVQHLSH